MKKIIFFVLLFSLSNVAVTDRSHEKNVRTMLERSGYFSGDLFSQRLEESTDANILINRMYDEINPEDNILDIVARLFSEELSINDVDRMNEMLKDPIGKSIVQKGSLKGVDRYIYTESEKSWIADNSDTVKWWAETFPKAYLNVSPTLKIELDNMAIKGMKRLITRDVSGQQVEKACLSEYKAGYYQYAYYFCSAIQEYSCGECIYILAELYRRGDYVERNYKISASFYRESSYLNYIHSSYILGMLLSNTGESTEDRTEGYHWLLYAKDNGHDQAERALAEMSGGFNKKEIEDINRKYKVFKKNITNQPSAH